MVAHRSEEAIQRWPSQSQRVPDFRKIPFSCAGWNYSGFVNESRAENTAEQALRDARRLATEGKYQEALEKHIWFHDNALRLKPGYYGVRLSFALGAWAELGKKYPKALEKLREIRDQNTTRLNNGENNRELFHDVRSMNRYLGESQATVKLFKRIAATDSEFASKVYELAEEELVKGKEYSLAKVYLGDPGERLAREENLFKMGIQHSKTSTVREAARRADELNFTSEVLRILTILRETGDPAAAKMIQAQALKTLDNEAIRKALDATQ
jgi:hypothetical protein